MSDKPKKRKPYRKGFLKQRRRWLHKHAKDATFADLIELAREVRVLFHPLSPQPVFVELVNRDGEHVSVNASEIVRIKAGSWTEEGDGKETVFLSDGSRYPVPHGPRGESRVLNQMDRAGIRQFALLEEDDSCHGPDDRDRFGDVA